MCNQSQTAKREKKKVHVAVHELEAGKVRDFIKLINVKFCKVWISRVHKSRNNEPTDLTFCDSYL